MKLVLTARDRNYKHSKLTLFHIILIYLIKYYENCGDMKIKHIYLTYKLERWLLYIMADKLLERKLIKNDRKYIKCDSNFTSDKNAFIQQFFYNLLGNFHQQNKNVEMDDW